MFGNFIDSVTKVVDSAVSDPVGFAVDTVTQPIRDAANVIDGLTEGELRLKAAARLGTDVALGMSVSELIEWYAD